MRQSHFICYDEEHALFDIFPKFLDFASNNNMITVNEDTFNFKYTYYDTVGKSLLKRGGFCRKFTRFELDDNAPPSFTIEYRPVKKSRTQRISSSQRKSMNELSKMLSVNLNFKELKYKGQNYTASIEFRNDGENKDEIYPHLDFIFEIGKVESGHTQMECPVAFFSLIDTSASAYNNFFANQLSDETEDCLKLFEHFMKSRGLKQISSNKYDELTQLISPEISEFDTHKKDQSE